MIQELTWFCWMGRCCLFGGVALGRVCYQQGYPVYFLVNLGKYVVQMGWSLLDTIGSLSIRIILCQCDIPNSTPFLLISLVTQQQKQHRPAQQKQQQPAGRKQIIKKKCTTTTETTNNMPLNVTKWNYPILEIVGFEYTLFCRKSFFCAFCALLSAVLWVKLDFIGINRVKCVNRGVILGNIGYQRGNRAVMVLKQWAFSFSCPVYVFVVVNLVRA